MSQRPLIRRILGVVVALFVAAVTACGVGSAPRGELADNQRILASCDPSNPPAALVAIDGTGSSASDQITAERMAAVESVVRTTAICSGRLRVLVFSASSAATTTLFDAPLHLHGATDNARLKRAQPLVEEVTSEIGAAYESAVEELPGGGSDITAQYRLAAEWATQVGDGFRLHVHLFTDGLQNIGIDVASRALTEQEAVVLAERTNVPELPGASVVVAGLGRVAGQPPASHIVEGLVAYYQALCRRTSADDCASVTDYAEASQ